MSGQTNDMPSAPGKIATPPYQHAHVNDRQPLGYIAPLKLPPPRTYGRTLQVDITSIYTGIKIATHPYIRAHVTNQPAIKIATSPYKPEGAAQQPLDVQVGHDVGGAVVEERFIASRLQRGGGGEGEDEGESEGAGECG